MVSAELDNSQSIMRAQRSEKEASPGSARRGGVKWEVEGETEKSRAGRQMAAGPMSRNQVGRLSAPCRSHRKLAAVVRTEPTRSPPPSLHILPSPPHAH